MSPVGFHAKKVAINYVGMSDVTLGRARGAMIKNPHQLFTKLYNFY